MGNDGGTLPTRKGLLQVRATEAPKQNVDADVLKRVAATQCAISRRPLRPPVVSDSLGRLYNKDSVVQYLLARSKDDNAKPNPQFGHLRGLKDVRELRLARNPVYDEENVDRRTDDNDAPTPFICPLTQRAMNGRHRFVYLVPCGCVMSENGLRATIADRRNDGVASESSTSAAACPICGNDFDVGNSLGKHGVVIGADAVIINGTDDEVDAQRKAMYRAREVEKARKKEIKVAAKTEKTADDAEEAKQKALHKEEKRKRKEEIARLLEEEKSAGTGTKRQKQSEAAA